MEEMDLSDGFSEDEYSRLSIDETNYSDYNDEDLIRILTPETFCPADIQMSTAPLESKANYICSRITYLDKLRIAAQSKLALYERLNNCRALTLRANLNEHLERNHVFWDLEHIVRKAQGELTRLSACPIPNCDKHTNKFHSPNTVLVKISPQPKIKPQKSRQRNSNEEFEIVQKNKIARKNSNDNIPNIIQTENRFNVLAETADPTNEQEVLKPQPVMLKITDNYNLLLQKINREFKGIHSNLANGYIRIHPTDDKSHKGIIDLLRSEKAFFYVVQPASERPIKVVLKGIPPDTNTEVIKQSLEDQNFHPLKIVNLKQQRSRQPLPMFLVELPNDKNAQKIYNIKTVGNLSITVESFRKKAGFTQCWNCNFFHHSSNNCQSEARCLKCGNSHKTADCEIKTKIENPTCINCGKSGHVASWKGCENFPKPRPNNNYYQQQYRTSFNSNWANSERTYAQTLSRNIRNNNDSSKTSHSSNHSQMAPPALNVESAVSDMNAVSNIKDILIIIKEFSELLKACPHLITIAKKLQTAADADAKIATFLEELIKIK
ncbi:Nucleic-acid-binding protein from transposon X-element [Araneus ventricosus]|uniref:Nucleic-acid-binding protein from transposon X-element n=1 Tax=Araneus ventricosus TaxID=182803 RepID=A0A4Y2TF92_ARAVE|nr:Nucleic-acid-binding protein from transposon X-element [Araneus ventricosus]